MIDHAREPSRSRRTGAIALLVGLLLAVPAASQAVPAHQTHGADDPAATAAELRAEALSIVERTGDTRRAADFLVKTAFEQLARDDSGRARNLRLAGRYYHHAGKLGDAYRAMLDAARAAHAGGQHALAANTLLDAGIAATEDGKQGAAWRAAHRAGYLLRTEHFTPVERLRILERVTYLPEAADGLTDLASDGDDESGEG
ncbi:MAG: hypothetical protein ACOC83_02140 [Gemmatimonadota bacterium]